MNNNNNSTLNFSFRHSLNGYNKDDVYDYIVAINNRFSNDRNKMLDQINKLQEQLESLTIKEKENDSQEKNNIPESDLAANTKANDIIMSANKLSNEIISNAKSEAIKIESESKINCLKDKKISADEISELVNHFISDVQDISDRYIDKNIIMTESENNKTTEHTSNNDM